MIGELWQWAFSGLIITVKGLLIYIWVDHKRDLNTVTQNHVDLKDKLMASYWNKDQTQDYIDRTVSSIDKSFNRVIESNEALVKELKKLNEKVIVLETIERVNGGFTRGSS